MPGYFFQESFETFEGLGVSSRSFKFGNLLQLLHNQLCQDSSVSFFWKGEQGEIEDGKCQLLKMAKSCYIVILIK